MKSALRNVSLASEQPGLDQVFLIVGDSKFPIPPDEFGTLGFKAEKVELVAPGTLAQFIDKPLRPRPATLPSDVFIGVWGPNLLGNLFYQRQDPASILQRNVLVAGWLSEATPDEPASPSANAAPNGIEDIHYNIRLDPVFVDRMYGPDGLSVRMDGAAYPGNPMPGETDPATPLPFAAGPPRQPGGPNTNTYNSWTLPGNGETQDIHGELNSWHINNTADIFHNALVGQGPPPEGWVNASAGTDDAGAWFPFDPLNSDEGPGPLRAGDYVIMRGVLWEDHWHDHFILWDGGLTRHHAWIEMHPPDWIVRVEGPQPNARSTRLSDMRILNPVLHLGHGGKAAPNAKTYPPFSSTNPPFLTPSQPGRVLEIRDVHRLDDVRPAFNSGTATVQESITDARDRLDVTVTLSTVNIDIPHGKIGQGRWHATWLIEWTERDPRDQLWVNDDGSAPPGAQGLDAGEGWHWTAGPPEPFLWGQSHESPAAAGTHWHGFHTADPLLDATTAPGAVLFAMAWLDPDNPPDEIMLQWRGTTQVPKFPGGPPINLVEDPDDHRAYWGSDLIIPPSGIHIPGQKPQPGFRRFRGPLPFTGEWVRLEVPARSVGLADAKISGMWFWASGGRVLWHRAGWTPGG